ncbi:MAG: carboxypeptidase regulatory-like domain-containing protein, partial [Candidatus Methanoperedens sp.]|nr:carboxypeptidase regulatory-like domain-containing protein [Candidatus Methanoperedens sp.]
MDLKINTGFSKKWIKRARLTAALIVFGAVFFQAAVPLASAAISQQTLRCDTGTSIGVDATNFTCTTASNPYDIGLLLNKTTGTSTAISIATAGNGPWAYAYFINNTAFPVPTMVTAYSASIPMRVNTNGRTGKGWYELGYYDPNGVAGNMPGNFVGLVNSTIATTTSSTLSSFAISFNGQSAVIPAGRKLAVRVWMNVSGSTDRPYYYSFSTAANSNSSFFVDISPLPGYNISGYVTNKTSGQPLIGATVQTSTSLNTTTNAAGFYNFTGISNGTYVINASLTGYAVNSINVTINGAQNTTANISLAPVPTYQLSGYITNASNGQAITSAAVTTNSNLSTSTDGTGYYSFTVGNGTYIITASKPGYSDNSTMQTINGAAVSNANIMLTLIPPSVGKILVATNRYVILDDYKTTTRLGTGFSSPGVDHGTTNSWTGKNTRINATALFIDNTGSPLSGRNITFNLYQPNGTELVAARVNTTTNNYGLANFSFDMDARNYYGNWTVEASNGNLYDNTSFIYNWWGCGDGSSSCGSTHASKSPTSGAPINSPYLNGGDATVNQNNAHFAASTNCTDCHQSFDGKPGGNTKGGANHTNNLSDVHKNVAGGCANPSCHQSLTAHQTNAVIGSCYNASGGCHGNLSWGRKDLSNKSTLNGIVSSYSSNNASTIYATFHTPNSTVPCIICHGPMHNITKPDPLQTGRNNNTEDSHCKTCHSSYNEHNSSNITSGGVNCTLCHSDDVHDIQVFAQNSTYVDLNHNNPNPARGNCTNCHQNASFFAVLEAQPKAGNYTGRNPPQIPVPFNHSTDPYAGALWNGSQSAYWDNTSKMSACYYCHGLSTLHSISALGSIGNIRGTNNLNQGLANSTWCASCHYKNAPGFSGEQFSPQPPEILNQNGLVPTKSGDGTTFTNHASYFSSGYNDSVCNNCHNNNLVASATSLNFSHNVNIGSGGGPDCISCHNINVNGSPDNKRINVTAMKSGVHGNLNRNATNSTSLDPINKACWACHGDGLEPTGHPVNKSNPWACKDCHNATTAFTSSNATINNDITKKKIYNHIPGNYTTDNFKIASDFWNPSVNCTLCHTKSTVYFNVTFTAVNPLAANVSHYANTSNLFTPTINCTLCHKSPANATEWYANITRHPAKTQALSFCANCHNNTNATTLHSQPLRIPMVIHGGFETGGGFDWENNSATLDGASCYACHGTGNPGTILANLQTVKLCENCHINVSSIFTGPNRTTFYSLRSDINDTLPYVYSHTNYSNITGTNVRVPSLGGTATYSTTCYSYNAVTGEGTCHAAPYFNRSNFGGYYAQYNDASGPVDKSDPPHWTVPIDRMPDTKNCLFCHNQSNETIRNGWGNAMQVNAGNMFGASDNSSCYLCHTRTGTKPFDFHSSEVVTGGGPGCLDCHNDSTPQNFTGLHYIDGTNFSISVHSRINGANATVNGIDYGINASCWACHNSTGYIIANNTHPDKRDTPFTC